MEGVQGVAIGGLFALGGGILSALVTLTLQRRQATAALRVHLFEKQLEAHAAVVRQLAALRLEVVRTMATSQVAGAGAAQQQAARKLNERAMETSAVLDDHNFYLDRTAGEAVVGFLAVAQRVRDGEELTADVVGVAYGKAIDVCQRVMAIPSLAGETYREVVGKPRRWPWRR